MMNKRCICRIACQKWDSQKLPYLPEISPTFKAASRMITTVLSLPRTILTGYNNRKITMTQQIIIVAGCHKEMRESTFRAEGIVVYWPRGNTFIIQEYILYFGLTYSGTHSAIRELASFLRGRVLPVPGGNARPGHRGLDTCPRPASKIPGGTVSRSDRS